MKKKLISALMCVTMVSTMLAGCGSGNGGSASGGDTESEAAESKYNGIVI